MTAYRAQRVAGVLAVSLATLMGAGLAMMAIDHLRANGKRLGKTSAELGWILEDNKATNNIIRSVGGVHYKTHRIYEKAL